MTSAGSVVAVGFAARGFDVGGIDESVAAARDGGGMATSWPFSIDGDGGEVAAVAVGSLGADSRPGTARGSVPRDTASPGVRAISGDAGASLTFVLSLLADGAAALEGCSTEGTATTVTMT